MFQLLMVDDRELVLVSLQNVLDWAQFGFTKIYTTTDPKEAQDILRKQRIDAALVDICMPGISGLELIQQAKQIPVDTCFAIISAYADFTFARQAIDLDVLGYCLKPISEEGVRPLLEKLTRAILAKRISRDPVFLERLMKEENLCQSFLREQLCADSEELVLMDICAPEVHRLLLEDCSNRPEQVLFLRENEAILFWRNPEAAREFLSKKEDLMKTAWVTCTECESSAQSVQIALQCLQTESYGRKDEKGVHWISSANTEMVCCFEQLSQYVQQNFSTGTSLRELAEKFGFSYSYLSKMFKKNVGMSFPEYLTKLRLEQACILLRDTNNKIVNVAEDVGFSDYHYFCNVFRQNVGVSPSQYRSQFRK